MIDRLTFKLLRDDAAAVYLNGREVYRASNLSRTARHTTYASSTIVDENAYATFEVSGKRLDNGKNVIAVEVHQASRNSSDLSFAQSSQHLAHRAQHTAHHSQHAAHRRQLIVHST